MCQGFSHFSGVFASFLVMAKLVMSSIEVDRKLGTEEVIAKSYRFLHETLLVSRSTD